MQDGEVHIERRVSHTFRTGLPALNSLFKENGKAGVRGETISRFLSRVRTYIRPRKLRVTRRDVTTTLSLKTDLALGGVCT